MPGIELVNMAGVDLAILLIGGTLPRNTTVAADEALSANDLQRAILGIEDEPHRKFQPAREKVVNRVLALLPVE